MVTVETGARLHFGFQNLSLAHPRLYGGVGVGIRNPRLVVDIEPAPDVRCSDTAVEPYLRSAVDALAVDGAKVQIRERFERHVGLGSGTQLALACLLGVARAHGREVDAREYAARLGRGGRSGVGVASFEQGGFIIDAGHPTTRFTTDPPETGRWTVPKPVIQRRLPDDWRFVLITPENDRRGPNGEQEDRQMRTAVERADPGIADTIAGLVTRRLLPAVAECDLAAFGEAVSQLGRLNGAWYADEQGGVYRPPAGHLIQELAESPAVTGTGQSSWGPTVYGVTDSARADQASEAATGALDVAGIDGTVRLVSPSEHGATVRE